MEYKEEPRSIREFLRGTSPFELHLREITLMDSIKSDLKPSKVPIGQDHANDGVLTPDGYPWADSIEQWFAVMLWPDVHAMEIMSRSRLARALEVIGRTVPFKGDSCGNDYAPYDGPRRVPIERPIVMPLNKQPSDLGDLSAYPKLECRITLPEMLQVYKHKDGKTIEGVQPEPHWRVYPPPRYLFEEERLQADIRFFDHWELVGEGNSSAVHRVLIQHPGLEEDMYAQSGLRLGANYPFHLYSKDFYRALNVFHLGHQDEYDIVKNTDPKVSDEDFEKQNRTEGRYGIPRWAMKETKDYGNQYDHLIKELLSKPPIAVQESSIGSQGFGQTLLAKVPFRSRAATDFVKNEGNMYNLMPDYLSEGGGGYIRGKPMLQPMPYVAAIPKFYGMYVNREGHPLLLLEDCGNEISSSRVKPLKPFDRGVIMSLVVRIHRFGMRQNSPFRRNVVVQPGPLSVPPEERSLDDPSFRIIDFGRGRHTPRDLQKEDYILRAEREEGDFATDIGLDHEWLGPPRLHPPDGNEPNPEWYKY